LDRADIEGRVLDVSYVLKTVVVLTSVTSEGGVTLTSDALKYTGDQGMEQKYPLVQSFQTFSLGGPNQAETFIFAECIQTNYSKNDKIYPIFFTFKVIFSQNNT
jgi:hypothetical protein